MPNVSIVVLTGFSDVFRQFYRSANKYASATKKIVITSRDLKSLVLREAGWIAVSGIDPFVFARNSNLGLIAAGTDDVILVNDDVQFTRQNTVEDLSKIAHMHPKVGALSPQFIGSVGNDLQRASRSLSDTTISPHRLAFTCVYLKRDLIDAVGLLDERFTGYGSDDDDYCLRIQKAGYDLAVTPEVVVRHGYKDLTATVSYARTMGNVSESAKDMYELFRTKWS